MRACQAVVERFPSEALRTLAHPRPATAHPSRVCHCDAAGFPRACVPRDLVSHAMASDIAISTIWPQPRALALRQRRENSGRGVMTRKWSAIEYPTRKRHVDRRRSPP
jgi:hypothetical protein